MNSLLNKSVGGPHALCIAVRCVHKFDIVSDNTQYAEMRVFRCGQTLKPGEELLHFLLLAGLGVLIGGIEFVLR